jgi:hypothetical protein
MVSDNTVHLNMLVSMQITSLLLYNLSTSCILTEEKVVISLYINLYHFYIRLFFNIYADICTLPLSLCSDTLLNHSPSLKQFADV